MLISLFRVTSWFDTVCNIVTRLVNFRKKNSCMNMNYTYQTAIFRSIFAQIYKFLVEKYIFTIFAYEFFKVKLKYCKLYQKYIIFGLKHFKIFQTDSCSSFSCKRFSFEIELLSKHANLNYIKLFPFRDF